MRTSALVLAALLFVLAAPAVSQSTDQKYVNDYRRVLRLTIPNLQDLIATTQDAKTKACVTEELHANMDMAYGTQPMTEAEVKAWDVEHRDRCLSAKDGHVQAVYPSLTSGNDISHSGNAKKSKVDRADFLKTKVDEAAAMCKSQIVATAKDPTSIQFAENYTYGFGRVVTRNWIFIGWEIMGRNTYGAVLRHSMTCTVSCTQEKGCSWIGLEE
jgi:hypothetical protein